MNAPDVQPQIVPPKKRRPIGLIVFGGVLLFTFMVYTQPFGMGTVARMAAILPFPVAQVNGGVVMYGRAFQKWSGLQQFYEVEGRELPSDFNQRLFESVLREKLIRQLMREREVFFPRASIAQVLQDAQDQIGDRDAFAREIRERYGWNVRQFERQVARPFVEAQTLEEALLKDRTLQTPKRERIEEAFARLEEGENFDGLVLEYSEDATSVFNGDVGWMTEEELPEAWRGPALHLGIGETSPVLDEGGRYVILRVDNRREADDDSGTPMDVNLSALIVNKVSLSDVVQDFAEESKVEVFVKF